MKPNGVSILAVRVVQGAFLFFTGAWCLLAYLPFTYHQVHQGNLLPGLTEFAGWLPYIWWPITGLAAWSVTGSSIGQRTRAAVYLAVHLVAGVLLIVRPLAGQLQTPAISLAWCLAAFASMAWTGWLDWSRIRSGFEWPQPDKGTVSRLFLASLASAVVLTAAYAVEAVWRMSAQAAKGEQALAAIFSLDAHLLFFMGIFVVLALVRGIAELLRRPAAAEFWMVAALAVLCGQFVLDKMIFPVVAFEGVLAASVALCILVAVVLFWSGICARLQASGNSAEDGLSLFLLPLTFWVPRGRTRAIWLAVLLGVAAGCALCAAAAGMDWNYLLQKTSAMLVWTVTFATIYKIVTAARREITVQLLLVSLAVLGTHRLLSAGQPKLEAALGPGGRSGSSLGRYAGYNASYKILYDWMAPREGAGEYYHFLAASTNLPRERALSPVDVRLGDGPIDKPGPRPHIFLFVVDSMRRDYLAPYNPAVTFTPGVAAFARESNVFENAFTRYAGTGLSEPSIWSGALLPHKQYVTPFHPMNSLEKLLDACGYQRFISVDTILDTLLNKGPVTTELDEGRLTMNYDLGHSLRELETKLADRATTSAPVFAYTQAQNLHISVINRAGRRVPAGETYPGFDAPYASRVKQVDAAFGEFIAFLKSKGWYDKSIVILTADHGDSLGEDGRWGHAYTLVPEVLRVPLIIHLPAAMQSSGVAATTDVAFLTDVTPSLYQLLGQGPIRKEDIFGKTLFAPDAASLAASRRDDWLVAASYAPIYGILHRGRELYVSDAVQYREFLYDLSGGASKSVSLGANTKHAYQELIRQKIQAIRAFYRMDRHD